MKRQECNKSQTYELQAQNIKSSSAPLFFEADIKFTFVRSRINWPFRHVSITLFNDIMRTVISYLKLFLIS